jgi:Zn-dependent protease
MMSELISNFNLSGFLDLAMNIAAVLLCIMVHEVSHGYAAYLLGDPTAKSNHRLSFNPIRHIDPFGALMMVLVGFGWAKPVPVDPRYFKNPKSGMALTSLAGPLSNFVLAYAALLCYFVALPFVTIQGVGILEPWLQFSGRIALLSIGLGLFNLIPFPPLDGFKVFGALLPNELYYRLLRYERYGMFVLMAVLWMGLLNTPLLASRSFVLNLLVTGAKWPYYLIAPLV